ncbi:hypothetical protein GCM10010345_04010 [Streptomyces canarius]|uniref:Uncharacterized protein n=1 Tax=Streptomyces canarius TaxID=285453 RepID=A0ABQ3CEY0_9ACTN|nr:hypothetical protein GCM10010345_04010 [Streptomyces canarius]
MLGAVVSTWAQPDRVSARQAAADASAQPRNLRPVPRIFLGASVVACVGVEFVSVVRGMPGLYMVCIVHASEGATAATTPCTPVVPGGYAE